MSSLGRAEDALAALVAEGLGVDELEELAHRIGVQAAAERARSVRAGGVGCSPSAGAASRPTRQSVLDAAFYGVSPMRPAKPVWPAVLVIAACALGFWLLALHGWPLF